MKCYTVINFNLSEKNTFSFQKSYKKYGVRMDDAKVHNGYFETSELPETKEILLKIYVH